MASQLNPTWWHSAESLEDSILNALAKPQHRERWKYTKSQRVFDLVTPAATLPSELRLDIETLLKDAPDTLVPFQRGHGLETITLSDDAIDLTEATSPLQVDIPDNTQGTMHREHVTGFGSFLWLNVGANASADVSLNALSGQSHWDSLHITLSRDARLTLNLHNLGAEIARQDIQIHCVEPGADVTISAAASITEGAHLDQQVTLLHKAAHTTSRQTFHTTAAAKANVTFNGRIHIYEQCPGVAAHLTNKNLALNDSATINTKPELEIYTDDVACSHGATIGALDPAELFYCVSRGIEPIEAQRMLGLGFLNRASAGPLAEQAREAFLSVLA